MFLVFIIFIVIILFIIGANKGSDYKVYVKKPDRPFPHKWREILIERVSFYHRLTDDEKEDFEFRVHVFLLNVRVIGVKSAISDTDRLLVASGATIPIFRFPNWHYKHLHQVEIYPAPFNVIGSPHKAEGLVGSGTMEGRMLISRPALHQGFINDRNMRNVVIHEFMHIIDKQDGDIDGIPSVLIDRTDVAIWVELIRKKSHEILKKKSNIREYAATNKMEFLAVVSEYFFERPIMLQKKHPELYAAMKKMFNVDLSKRFRRMKLIKKNLTKRNDPCPCHSGEKFKKCCLKHNTGH